MSESKKKSILGQIFIAAAVALLAGGTSPWWWKELFGRKERPPERITEVHGENGPREQEPPGNRRRPTPREEDISKGPFIITTHSSNLFRGPDLFEPIIADLPRGKRFKVIQEHKVGPQTWFKITYENKTGWVPGMSVILEE